MELSFEEQVAEVEAKLREILYAKHVDGYNPKALRKAYDNIGFDSLFLVDQLGNAI